MTTTMKTQNKKFSWEPQFEKSVILSSPLVRFALRTVLLTPFFSINELDRWDKAIFLMTSLCFFVLCRRIYVLFPSQRI